MKAINVLGLDLAKAVFQLHGTDLQGRVLLRKQLKRKQLLEFLAQCPPMLVGMEACGGAHYWAREIRKLGHDVRLIAAQFVKPYVKSNKNDSLDAEAIAEAVTRPNMRFVPVKGTAQQDIQSIHRIRTRCIQNRTAAINELHGLALEYGLALSRSKALQEIAVYLDPEKDLLSSEAKQNFQLLLEEINHFELRIRELDRRLQKIFQASEICKRLEQIPGVGVITATTVLAAVSDPNLFRNGREFSAWLGLVPKQCSSGGKTTLLRISKRGDGYLRSLLVHGARSIVCVSKRASEDGLIRWAQGKKSTRGTHRAVVALANKLARIIWVLLKTGGSYRASSLPAHCAEA